MGQANKNTPAQSTANANKHKAALAAARKAKNRKILITVAIILAAAIIITPLSLFANGSVYRITKVATVGDENYSVAEYNYYFYTAYLTTYNNFYNTYGDYTSYILDKEKPLNEQQYSEDLTWADYFKESALSNMRNVAMLCAEAEKAGFSFNEEQQTELKNMIDAAGTTASYYGYSTAAYLSSAYGSGMTEKIFERCVTMSYTAEIYAQSIIDTMTYTKDQLQARYDADPNNYDTISFHMFLVPSVVAEGGTEEEAMAAAKVNADEMAANVKTTAEFAEYVRKLCSEDDLANYEDDNATIQHYIKYSAVSSYEFGDWLFDTARAAGDTYVAAASGGYQVVMFLDREDTHYNLVNVRHILIAPETDETTGAATDETWAAAEQKAEQLLADWKAGEATEDSFATLANENTADTGSNSTGGLYENVYKGQTVSAFNDWCFDESRVAGDTGIVKTTYGYHVMYYIGEGGDYWTSVLTSELQSEDYSAWQEEKLAQYPITTNATALRLGRDS
ncbi:MAG: peptidylprolyl isomerase [Clostridiaceae bacterium]|nr:peptidylprolyl isomerase [Clostridiaceae bacterium]